MKLSLRRVVDWCGGSTAALREKKNNKERKEEKIYRCLCYGMA